MIVWLLWRALLISIFTYQAAMWLWIVVRH